MAPEQAGPPPLPPPNRDDANDPIAMFQDRAKPIISQSGGFANVGCLVKLKALSQELDLSEEQFNEAIASLRGETLTGPEAAERQRREKRFLKRLRKTLNLQNGNLLSFRQRRSLVEAGVQGKHALPPQAVERLIDEVAREENVRFTAVEDAQQYVANLIRQVMGEAPVLDNNMRRKIWREGKKSGLTRGQVEDIIRKRVTVNRLHNWSNWIAPGIAVLAILGTVLFLAYLGYSNLSGDPEVVEPATVEPALPPKEPEKSKADAWWDVRLAVAMGTSRASLPSFWPILDRARFNDPALRGEAYEDLIRQLFDKGTAAKVLHERDQAKILREIIVGCHALDPSDEAATRLRDALLAVVPATAGDPAERVTDYGPIFWAMETSVAALRHDKLDSPRADALALAIAERVQANFDRRLQPSRRMHQAMGALTTHLYRVLITSVKSQSAFALERRDALLQFGRKYLGVEAQQSLDTDFLVALLSKNEDGWKKHQERLDVLVLHGMEPNALKLFTLFQKCSNAELQTFLAERLCVRFGVLPKSMTVEDVTRAIQDTIGLVTGDRRQMLESRAKPLLDKPSAKQPRVLLDEAARLAQLATLGCALAQGDLGHAEFDRGFAAYEKRATVAAPDPDQTPTKNPTLNTPPPWVVDNISYLFLGRGNVTDRMRRMESLADTASDTALTPQQGAHLADYLLKVKSNPREYEKLSPRLADLGKWKSVRLALADALAAGRVKAAGQVQRDRVLETVEGVLGQRFTPVAKQPWPDQQRILSLLLLQDVYNKLGTGKPTETQGKASNKTQQEITDCYRAQAQLLGLPPETYSTMASPSEAVKALIAHRAAKLGAQTPHPRDKAYLASLPHQLAAVEYLGENDLARTVLLQRIWTRLLAASVAKQNPARIELARKIFQNLQAGDGKATHILTQLRNGEAAILRMWILLGEAKS